MGSARRCNFEDEHCAPACRVLSSCAPSSATLLFDFGTTPERERERETATIVDVKIQALKNRRIIIASFEEEEEEDDQRGRESTVDWILQRFNDVFARAFFIEKEINSIVKRFARDLPSPRTT